MNMDVIRIMLADDHAMMRDGLRLLLSDQSDIDIVGETGDGLQAVRMAAELKPDVAVIDISLPGLDGIQATRRITAVEDPPAVITLSMHSESHYVRDALKAGARGYVLKESAATELRSAIDHVLKGDTYVTPSIAGVVFDSLVRGSVKDELSERETQVLVEIACGSSTQEIAEKLNLSPKTVESHRKNIMDKLEIRSIAGLTRYAIRQGLTSL